METLLFCLSLFQILGEQPNQINNKNDKGLTPLHIACSEDLSECVVALLCAGADMNMAGTMDTFFFLNDLFLYLAIDTVFHTSGIIQHGMEISSKSHV